MSTREKERAGDPEEVSTCEVCGGTPCEWEECGEDVVDQSRFLHNREVRGKKEVIADSSGIIASNSKMRKALHRAFTHLKCGRLGKGSRMPIFSCAAKKIREMCPDRDGNYMEFQRRAERQD